MAPGLDPTNTVGSPPYSSHTSFTAHAASSSVLVRTQTVPPEPPPVTLAPKTPRPLPLPSHRSTSLSVPCEPSPQSPYDLCDWYMNAPTCDKTGVSIGDVSVQPISQSRTRVTRLCSLTGCPPHAPV